MTNDKAKNLISTGFTILIIPITWFISRYIAQPIISFVDPEGYTKLITKNHWLFADVISLLYFGVMLVLASLAGVIISMIFKSTQESIKKELP